MWIELDVFGGREDAQEKKAGHSFGILVDIWFREISPSSLG